MTATLEDGAGCAGASCQVSLSLSLSLSLCLSLSLSFSYFLFSFSQYKKNWLCNYEALLLRLCILCEGHDSTDIYFCNILQYFYDSPNLRFMIFLRWGVGCFCFCKRIVKNHKQIINFLGFLYKNQIYSLPSATHKPAHCPPPRGGDLLV